jgi:GNAT superfamily N-acetyltransferase
LDREDIIARADENYYAAFRRLATSSDDGEVVEGGGLLLIRTGVPVSRFNVAFVTRRLAEPRAVIDRAIAYFDGHRLPFVVRLRAGVDDRAERAAEAAGLPFRDTVPGMVMTDVSRAPAQPSGLEVRPVHDPLTLDDHLAILSASFDMPIDLARRLLNESLLSVPDTELFVGYVDGAPVASSALITSDRVAGVWNVGCIPSHRKRGLGEAMTWHAVRRGAEIGCIMANLQASEMGQPIYGRMGFEVVAGYRTFVRDGY